MADLDILRDRLHQELPRLEEKYSVASLELFGSYVRGEETGQSDLDVLVTFHRVPGLLEFIRLEDHLSDLLGLNVDLVMKEALKPRVRDHVLREAIAV